MKNLLLTLMMVAGFAMQVATIHAQSIDVYYAGCKNDSLAVVYKNNELLYSNYEEESWYCSVIDLQIASSGDVYYAGNGNAGAYIWKNGERICYGGYRSTIRGICYNEEENLLYSVGDIFYEETVQQKGAIWRGDELWDTLGVSGTFLNDIDIQDGHRYMVGSNHFLNGSGDLMIWKDEEPLYLLGSRDWFGIRNIVCHDGHVYAFGAIRTNVGQFSYDGILWKDGEVLYNYGSYAYIYDFCIDGDDIYACGEINVENLEQKAVVWKNDEVLYEFDYQNFIRFYAIVKAEDDLLFGGAIFNYSKNSDAALSNSHGVLFKNGEPLEIDPECDDILVIATKKAYENVSEDEFGSYNIFPNPANDLVQINGPIPTEIQVFNSLGQLMSVFNNTDVVDLQGLPKGVYAMHIRWQHGNCVRKIIKE